MNLREHVRWLVTSLVLTVLLASAGSGGTTDPCPCLTNGGEPLPGSCPCDVVGCYSRCTETHPYCQLQCVFDCRCSQGGIVCLDHVDPGPTPTVAPRFCPGDCNNDRAVTIDELVTGVNVALERVDSCVCVRSDVDHDGTVSISEIVTAVDMLLRECATSIPSPTATPVIHDPRF